MDTAIHIKSKRLVCAFDAHESYLANKEGYEDPNGFCCESCGAPMICVNFKTPLEKCSTKHYFRTKRGVSHTEDCEINSAYATYKDFQEAAKLGIEPPLLILDEKGLRVEKKKREKDKNSDLNATVFSGEFDASKGRQGNHRARNIFNLPIQRILEIRNVQGAKVRVSGETLLLKDLMNSAVFKNGYVPTGHRIFFGWAWPHEFDNGTFTYYFSDTKRHPHFNDGTAIYLKDTNLLYEDRAISRTRLAIRQKKQVEIIVYGRAVPKETKNKQLTEIKDIKVMNVRPHFEWLSEGNG